MKISVYNDQPELLYPLTRLRPAWEVIVGGRTLRQQLRRAFSAEELIWQTSRHRRETSGLHVNGRAVPTDVLVQAVRAGKQSLINQAPLLAAPWEAVAWHDQILWEEANYLAQSKAYTSLLGSTVGVRRTRQGPVVIHRTAQVGDYTVLEGPVIIGERALVHDFTKITASFIGAVSKVAGEIAHSTFYPYSNKQHFGFVGHSVIGSWVNVAGGTSTANLKNTLGLVRADRSSGLEETQLQFLGSILGDYVKTGLNCALMPGTIADVGSHLYGTVSGYIPPLNIPMDVSLRAIERTMARRGKKLTERERKLLKNLNRNS